MIYLLLIAAIVIAVLAATRQRAISGATLTFAVFTALALIGTIKGVSWDLVTVFLCVTLVFAFADVVGGKEEG